MSSTISALTTGGGGIVMSGDSSGDLSLLSGVNTVVAVTSTGVAVTGTLAATGAITGSSTVAGSTGILYPLTSGTAVASTSGTSIDFTSIPSWVKRITFMLSGVSTNGASYVQVQLGAGSVTTSGYSSASGVFYSSSAQNANATTGFHLLAASSACIRFGLMTITNITSNTWVSSHSIGDTGAGVIYGGGGSLALGGTLDRVRITTVNGTDTFDAGTVNILYE